MKLQTPAIDTELLTDCLPDQLEGLFDVATWASAGEADALTIEQLSLLRAEEVPPNFDNWVEKRQREYRAGRHHARSALALAGLHNVQVPRGPDGIPQFPSGVHGCITHTGSTTTFAASAICLSDSSIGLDAENHKLLSPDMINAIMQPVEQQRFQRFTKSKSRTPKELGLYSLWVFSMKEAYYKCVYPTCAAPFGFLDVDVEVNTIAQSFRVTLSTDKYPSVPRNLTGNYHIDPKRVICGVTWKANSGTEPTKQAHPAHK